MQPMYKETILQSAKHSNFKFYTRSILLQVNAGTLKINPQHFYLPKIYQLQWASKGVGGKWCAPLKLLILSPSKKSLNVRAMTVSHC